MCDSVWSLYTPLWSLTIHFWSQYRYSIHSVAFSFGQRDLTIADNRPETIRRYTTADWLTYHHEADVVINVLRVRLLRYIYRLSCPALLHIMITGNKLISMEYCIYSATYRGCVCWHSSAVLRAMKIGFGKRPVTSWHMRTHSTEKWHMFTFWKRFRFKLKKT